MNSVTLEIMVKSTKAHTLHYQMVYSEIWVLQELQEDYNDYKITFKTILVL